MDATQLIIGTAIVLIGVYIGGSVAKWSGFIYPWDFVTVGIAIAGILYTIIFYAELIPQIPREMDPIWLIPFYLGYMVGFLIIGLTSYVKLIDQQYRNKMIRIFPTVIWNDGKEDFLIEQKWGALWDRWVHGIKHHIISNAPLEADWTESYKQPAFPRFSGRAIYVEDISQPSINIVKEGMIRTLKEYTTTIIVARGSMNSKAELATEEGTLYKIQLENARLESEIYMLRLEMPQAVTEASIQLGLHANRQKPSMRAYDMVSRWKEFMNREPKIEEAAVLDAVKENLQMIEKEKEEVVENA